MHRGGNRVPSTFIDDSSGSLVINRRCTRRAKLFTCYSQIFWHVSRALLCSTAYRRDEPN